MAEHVHTYRDMLRSEFAARCSRNRQYSLRSFARDLNLRPSHLSEVLNEKLGLSANNAQQIAHLMGLSESERTRFVASVEALHSRSAQRRKAASEKLDECRKENDYKVLEEQVFEIISDWHHYAILELVQTDDFVPRISWIGDRLGMHRIEVELAVTRLKRVGLLKISKNKWTVTEQFPATKSGVPSKAIKNFHHQIISKALDALYEQSVEKRDFSAMTFSINPDDLNEIKDEIRLFRRSLEKKYKARSKRREVYSLAIQFFSLTQPVGFARTKKQAEVPSA